MRHLIAIGFVTLDGVVQGSGGPEEDTSGGFAHGGWVGPYADPVQSAVIRRQMSLPFDLLLGRTTFQIWCRTGRSIPTSPGPPRSGVVSWCDGVLALDTRTLELGTTSLSLPRLFVDQLRAARRGAAGGGDRYAPYIELFLSA